MEEIRVDFDKNAMARDAEEEVFAVEDRDEEIYTDAKDNEDEENVEKGVFRFSKPVLLDDGEVREINYDFTKIKPIQYLNICKQVAKKEYMVNPALNMSVQANMFCKAADIPVSIIKTQITVPDFQAMCLIAQNFLLSSRDNEESDLL